MYPFTQSVNPAVRTHLDSQVAFLNDMSKSMFQSFEKLWGLNIQLVNTFIEETTLVSKQVLTSERHTDVLGALTSRAQPVAEKLRSYQQHIARIAADSQVELAKVTEEHVPEASRTAHKLAEEVARTASEETERSIRVQQENLRKFSDPFNKGNGQDGQQSPRSSGNAGDQQRA
jgi:phasin family protein